MLLWSSKKEAILKNTPLHRKSSRNIEKRMRKEEALCTGCSNFDSLQIYSYDLQFKIRAIMNVCVLICYFKVSKF